MCVERAILAFEHSDNVELGQHLDALRGVKLCHSELDKPSSSQEPAETEV